MLRIRVRVRFMVMFRVRLWFRLNFVILYIIIIFTYAVIRFRVVHFYFQLLIFDPHVRNAV